MSIRYTAADLVNTMIELERTGEDFYSSAAHQTTNLAARDLFARLAKEESRHRLFYEQLRGKLHEEVEQDEDYMAFLRDAIASRFQLDEQNAGASHTLAEALDIAVCLEKDAILFLGEFGSLLGDANAGTVESMRNQERGHLRLVQQFRRDAGIG